RLASCPDLVPACASASPRGEPFAMRSSESAEYYAALRSELDQARGARLAIPLSGHPDPDAMASGWALAELAARAGLVPSLLFARPVSHAENRLMVTALGVPL